jgi:hypothetical protein
MNCIVLKGDTVSRQLFLAFFEINLDIFRYVCLILCNLRQRFAAFKNTISTPEEILNVGKNRYNFSRQPND